VSLENKINKPGPFNLNRAINDFNNGSISAFSAKPDFGIAHQPHVDLNVTFNSGLTQKYRIYDTTGASNLLNDCGPKGIEIRR
jgi:hypothetical protein